MKKIICYCTIGFLILVSIIILLWTKIIICSEPDKFYITTILTLLGFFIQIIVVVWGFRLGLSFEDDKRKSELNDKTENIDIIEYPNLPNEKKYHLKIINNSNWPIHNCGAYVSINNTIDDLENPDEVEEQLSNYLFIDRTNGREIKLEKLSWAFKNAVNRNQDKININSGEVQDLMVFNLVNNKHLEIASEDGYSSDNGHSRCVLKNKNYILKIRIVSDDTKAKDFDFIYDANTKTLNPLK